MLANLAVEMTAELSGESTQFAPTLLTSPQSLRALSFAEELYDVSPINADTPSPARLRQKTFEVVIDGLARRLKRERRRRKVGRAYDMAREIARVVPRGSEVLDVGCGNGFIAHHLSVMLGANVLGIDVTEATEALIDYQHFDGEHFPVCDNSVDAVLLCYVLHHAQNIQAVFSEVRRVLRAGGRAVIYEDIPASWWDRAVCSIHNRQWRDRTGPCTFRSESEWRRLFTVSGFEVINERPLARSRNLSHPVSRWFYCLRLL